MTQKEFILKLNLQEKKQLEEEIKELIHNLGKELHYDNNDPETKKAYKLLTKILWRLERG